MGAGTRMYFTTYESELVGTLALVSDGDALVHCEFETSRHFPASALAEMERADDLPVLAQARGWLDAYFAGDRPDPHELPLAPAPTPFQQLVRDVLIDVPYGATCTYGEIAARLRAETGKRQASQAVGGAVGRNPICIIVPCHRVVGADGNLTGFGGGMDKKVALLQHEGVDTSRFWVPKA